MPPLLPRFMFVEGNGHGPAWVPLEDVIAANLDSLFPGMVIAESWSFRVTRHSDLEIDDDEAEDLLATIEEELRRQRFSRAVRLEVEEGMPDHVIALLTRELQVSSADAHELPAPLGLTDLWSLVSLDRPDLKPPPFHRSRRVSSRRPWMARRISSRHSAPRTSWSITRTTRSPARSRPSSSRRRWIHRSSPSSRRCTGPRARVPSSTP